jgi:hypothetical protein
MTWLRAMRDAIARMFWALLALNGDQQRALMTWAILAGMAVLSFGAWQLVDLMVAAKATSAELAEICKMVIALLGLFCCACVLIARGGEMTIKAPGGLEISARGAAATELGKQTPTPIDGGSSGSNPS